MKVDAHISDEAYKAMVAEFRRKTEEKFAGMDVPALRAYMKEHGLTLSGLHVYGKLTSEKLMTAIVEHEVFWKTKGDAFRRLA